MDTLRIFYAACSSRKSPQSTETTENQFRWTTEDLWNLRQKSETFHLQNGSLEFSLRFEWKTTSKTNIVVRSLLICVKKNAPNVFGEFVFSVNGWFFSSFRFENYDSGTYIVFGHEVSVFEKMMKKCNNSFVDVKWVNTEGKSEMLNENLNWLLESGELSDTVIQTQDGSQLSVHKSILSARSPVFLAMFKSDMLEAKNNCIEITDLLPETVKTLLEYMYTERLPELTYDSATELLKASDKYDIPCLKQSCSRYLMQHLNISNAIDLLSTMDTYREYESKRTVLKYIVRHRDHFLEPGSFDRVNDPELLKEILRAVLRK